MLCDSEFVKILRAGLRLGDRHKEILSSFVHWREGFYDNRGVRDVAIPVSAGVRPYRSCLVIVLQWEIRKVMLDSSTAAMLLRLAVWFLRGCWTLLRFRGFLCIPFSVFKLAHVALGAIIRIIAVGRGGRCKSFRSLALAVMPVDAGGRFALHSHAEYLLKRECCRFET